MSNSIRLGLIKLTESTFDNKSLRKCYDLI